MGDYYTNVIPIDVEPGDAQAVAAKVVEFMVSHKIIQPEISDCTLSKYGGYAPAENYENALTAPYPELLKLRANGVEVVVERSAFDSGGLEEIYCPNCNGSVMDTDWGQALTAWMAQKTNDAFSCPACGYHGSVTTYKFDPPFVFAELGFTFWNWGDSFKESFIKELEDITDSRIDIITGKL